MRPNFYFLLPDFCLPFWRKALRTHGHFLFRFCPIVNFPVVLNTFFRGCGCQSDPLLRAMFLRLAPQLTRGRMRWALPSTSHREKVESKATALMPMLFALEQHSSFVDTGIVERRRESLCVSRWHLGGAKCIWFWKKISTRTPISRCHWHDPSSEQRRCNAWVKLRNSPEPRGCWSWAPWCGKEI